MYKTILTALILLCALTYTLSCSDKYVHLHNAHCYCLCDDIFTGCKRTCHMNPTATPAPGHHTHESHCEIRCDDHMATCLKGCNDGIVPTTGPVVA